MFFFILHSFLHSFIHSFFPLFQFIVLMKHFNRALVKLLRDIFDKFDTDKSGFLTRDKIKKAACALDETATDAEVINNLFQY